MSAFRSVYTVDKFDGLVLQIDQYGGSGGKIRGFLNDGTTGYRNHHAVDSLAFGHCDYAYRNLGRMSKITLKQDHGGFQVFVDDKTCFSSSDVCLGYWSTCFKRFTDSDHRYNYRQATSSVSPQLLQKLQTLSRSANL